jgi:glutathione synthase/RimK-type ligase-like ATP-grasp enzyme
MAKHRPSAKAAPKAGPKRVRRIGILRGMETTFPDALIPTINETHGERGVVAEFVQLDAVRMDTEPGYDVVLDRISHEVPFYRSWLKWAAIKGAVVVNNPFWWSADDKFIDNVIAEQVGVAVPRSVILPHKERPPRIEDRSLRNLRYPVDWDGVFRYVGFPAYLKPHDGGGWRGVTRVENAADFFNAYDASGDDCMMLQENIEFEEYYRCYGVGRRDVRVMRYNPIAEPHLRYKDVPPGPIPPDRLARLERNVLAICIALGYDLNTVELAVRDGVPYAIDFMNPAPDADYHSVGDENFEWIVRTMAEFLVEKALEPRRARKFSVARMVG